MRKFVSSFALLLLITGFWATELRADTVVVSNSGFGGAVDDGPGAILYTSWSQTGSFNNVSVSAQLDGSFPFDQTFSGQAFLTTQVGTGTTIADQIATAPFSVAAGASGLVTLFTGLNLGPGNYFLVISDTSGLGGWDLTGGPSVTAPGVTTITDHCELFGTPSYPPAGSPAVCSGNLLAFEVVSVSQTGAVPEPAALGMLGLGLTGLFGVAMLRRRSFTNPN